MKFTISGSKISNFFTVLVNVIMFSGLIHAQTIIYNNFPTPVPPTPPNGNLASWAYEANGVNEFGNAIGFAPGTPRLASTIKVIMSSFACGTSGHWTTGACVTTPGATFNQSLTLNIYSVGPGPAFSVGPKIGTVTQTFAIPFRPSANATCPDPKQWKDALGFCYNGIATVVNFNLLSAGVPVYLPNQAIVSITFNTSTAGYAPLGTATACFATGFNPGCPYDGLNFAIEDNLSVGSNVVPNDNYEANRNANPAQSCDGLAGPFRLDINPAFSCWAPNQHPNIQVAAIPADVFQVRYASNLTSGDSVINLTNNGFNGASLSGPGFGTAVGNICVNVYAFSPDEQLVSCCSCLITPNGLASLSVNNDLIASTLTGTRPNSIVVKLVTTGAGPTFTGTACTNSAAQAGSAAFPITSGLDAFGTTLHQANTGFATTETPFGVASLSAAELASINGRCTNILGNGSTFGVCRSCRNGGLSSSLK